MANATARKGSGVGTRRGNGQQATAAAAPARNMGRASKFDTLISRGLLKELGNFGQYISVVDAAAIFGIAKQTARQWTKNGKLPLAFTVDEYGKHALYMDTASVIQTISVALDRLAV